MKNNSMLPLPYLNVIVAAIGKAVGHDLKQFISESSHKTNNAVLQLRGDLINTNTSEMLSSASIDVKLFKRSFWTGCLLIDRERKVTLNITTGQNLTRIQQKEQFKHPHYIKSLCFVENRSLKKNTQYVLFPEDEDDTTILKDYLSIVGDVQFIEENYQHYILTYTARGYNLFEVNLLLLNRNLDVIEKYDLSDLIEPDFADLTSTYNLGDVDAVPLTSDSHSLVSVKEYLPRKYSKEPEKKPKVEIHREELIIKG